MFIKYSKEERHLLLDDILCKNAIGHVVTKGTPVDGARTVYEGNGVVVAVLDKYCKWSLDMLTAIMQISMQISHSSKAKMPRAVGIYHAAIILGERSISHQISDVRWSRGDYLEDLRDGKWVEVSNDNVNALSIPKEACVWSKKMLLAIYDVAIRKDYIPF